MASRQLIELREKLLSQQFLFDDPAAYRAGVYDAFDAVMSLDEDLAAASGGTTLRLTTSFRPERDGSGDGLVGDAEGTDQGLGVGS